MLKCQYQPTCCQGKPQMRGIAPPGMFVPWYNDSIRLVTANAAPHSQEMAENLECTPGYRRLCTGLDSAPRNGVIALVSLPSAKLKQYTSDSRLLNLMYEVGSIYYLYIPKAFPATAPLEIFIFIYQSYIFLI